MQISHRSPGAEVCGGGVWVVPSPFHLAQDWTQVITHKLPLPSTVTESQNCIKTSKVISFLFYSITMTMPNDLVGTLASEANCDEIQSHKSRNASCAASP